MAAPLFRTLKEFLEQVAPPWLKQPQGAALLRGLGDVKDSQVARTRDGVKARFPSHAPRDALDALGGERGLPRGPVETDVGYAARLRAAWDIWEYASTATGILRALYYLGYTNAELISRNGIVSKLDGSANLVKTSLGHPFVMRTPDVWNQFVLMFPTPYIPTWVSNGVPAQASAEGQLIISTVLNWKPAFAMLDRVIIQGTGPMWGYPAGVTWGGSRVWGGGTAPIIWNIGA